MKLDLNCRVVKQHKKGEKWNGSLKRDRLLFKENQGAATDISMIKKYGNDILTSNITSKKIN